MDAAARAQLASLAPLAPLAEAGFDLVHALDARAAAAQLAAPWLASGPPVGILVGNTRALWPRFCAARAAAAHPPPPHPLDDYCERALAAAFAAHPAFAPARGSQLYFAHRTYGGAYLPLQRLAAQTGLGALAPSHLVIHPEHGPWIALRAVALVEGAPPRHAPIPLPCRCGEPCARALARATGATGADARRAWLEVREACTLRASRYSDEQIAFHHGIAPG
jgi:hypothetical protein